jgi:hypothetical protein
MDRATGFEPVGRGFDSLRAQTHSQCGGEQPPAIVGAWGLQFVISRRSVCLLSILLVSVPLTAAAQAPPRARRLSSLEVEVSRAYPLSAPGRPSFTAIDLSSFTVVSPRTDKAPIKFRWEAGGQVGWSRRPDGAFHHDALMIGGGIGVALDPALEHKAVGYFARVTAGLEHDNSNVPVDVSPFGPCGCTLSETSFMLRPGGGILVRAGGRADVVGEVDYKRVFSASAQNIVSAGAGIRLKF